MNDVINVREKHNIKAIIMYDGSSYEGWQRLTNSSRAIQGVIEECLQTYFTQEIKIIASGRTDKGVHATRQVINFYCNITKDLNQIKHDLNQLLPEDIKIVTLTKVNKNFHSRFDAKAKTYEYRMFCSDMPVFMRKYSYLLNEKVDIEAMKVSASYLIGTHDFKSFSTDRKDGKSTVRTIYDIHIHTIIHKKYGRPIEEIRIAITGNGFLYNMVRIIVGTLIEVGVGKRKPEEMKYILNNKLRSSAGITINSSGLFLTNVDYGN